MHEFKSNKDDRLLAKQREYIEEEREKRTLEQEQRVKQQAIEDAKRKL